MVRGKFQMVWIFRNTQISKISNKPLDTRHYLVLLVEENLPVKKRESKKWVSDLKKSQILQPNINKSPCFEMDPYCVILLKPLLFLQQKIIFSTSTIPRNPWGTPEGNMTQTFSPQHQTFSPIFHSHWQILVLIGWRTTAVAHGGRNVTMLSASYFWIEKNIYLNSFQRSFYEQEGEKRLNMHLTEWCKKGPLMFSSTFLQMSSKLICLYHFQTRK